MPVVSGGLLRRSFAAAVLGITIGVTGCGGEAGSPTPGPIAFAAHTGMLVVVKPDGTGHLLTGKSGEGSPAWSPDGEQIAFERVNVDDYDRPACSSIWVMSADGSDELGLTPITERDEGPAWSPDGESIAFGRWNYAAIGRDPSGEDRNEVDIYVISADGDEPKRLTDRPGVEADPTWSPDGERIAFSGDGGNGADIYVVNADGSGLRRLTDTPKLDYNPAWSPDGKTIAFERSGDHARIVLMNEDRSEQREIGPQHFDWYNPAWSPDGKQIAFTAEDENAVWVTDVNGRNVHKVWSEDLSQPDSPDWAVAKD